MSSIRSMVAAGLLVSAFGLVACGGNKSGVGGTTDAAAGDGARGGSSGGGAGGASGGSGTAGVGGSGTAGAGGGGTAGAGGTTTMPISCEVPNPQCNDGVDNGDDDTLIDSADPECQGPCDNDEGSFATGIPGDNIDACKQDCFFDGNSGMGDDGCEWNLKCDSANPGGTSCPYDATFQNCPKEQSAKCVRNCQKLTPNGCDCFGCCAVDVNGQTTSVLLASTCTAAKFGDPVACPRCTQNTACINTCGACEVCIGRPTPPASCNPSGTDAGVPDGGSDASTPGPDGGSMQCPEGITACSATAACGTGFYCQTGCCVRFTVE